MSEDSPLAPKVEERRRSLFSARDKLQPVKAPAPPAKPKRRKGGLVGMLSALFTVSVLLLVGVWGGVAYFKGVIDAKGPLLSDRAVVVDRGAGADEVAEMLEREGVITNRVAFEFLAYSHYYGSLKAGEFLIRKEASIGEVIDTLSNARPIEHSITIPEGLTSEQVVARLKESDLLLGDIAFAPPEGSILPATYKIARGTSRDQLISRMQSQQKQVLNEVWAKRSKDIPAKSPSDLVILASIIEKETGKQDERTRVAGVFVNRLQKNMRLQSDPTIVYGLVGGKGSLGRGITSADIQSQTPYNTYVINGLPPGPIANPGRASLEAAANPSRTKDLFFVADGTGGHAFAETLEQHNRNVQRWRQFETQQKEAAAAAAAPPAAPGFAPPPAAAVDPSVAPGTRGEAQPDASSSFTAGGQPANPLGAARPGTVTQPKAKAGADAPPRAGTRNSPVVDRSFDLNSSKTVPTLR